MKEFLNTFKALSDKTRLRIMYLLNTAKVALCVCEIMDSVNESQYNISRHLKVLQNAGLVEENKNGRWIFYSIVPEKKRFYELITEAIGVLPEEMFQKDIARLRKRLSFRQEGKCVVGMNSPNWKEIVNRLDEESRCL